VDLRRLGWHLRVRHLRRGGRAFNFRNIHSERILLNNFVTVEGFRLSTDCALEGSLVGLHEADHGLGADRVKLTVAVGSKGGVLTLKHTVLHSELEVGLEALFSVRKCDHEGLVVDHRPASSFTSLDALRVQNLDSHV